MKIPWMLGRRLWTFARVTHENRLQAKTFYTLHWYWVVTLANLFHLQIQRNDHKYGLLKKWIIIDITRMHSSRMRTVRCIGRVEFGWGLCLSGGCLPREVPAQEGGVHLPPVDRMRDACENITFPELLLRTVTINMSANAVPSKVDWNFVMQSCMWWPLHTNIDDHTIFPKIETSFVTLIAFVKKKVSLTYSVSVFKEWITQMFETYREGCLRAILLEQIHWFRFISSVYSSRWHGDAISATAYKGK